MTKIDPYKHKERYLRWKEKTQSAIPEISRENSELIKEYLRDMESGVNIARGTKKGSRSYIRLNTLRQKMAFLSKEFKSRFELDIITGINESQLFGFFQSIKNKQKY
ncbi:MAG: hypothetical protein Q8N63_00335 [Nanoarchaeota archaeon]|nr:hypothetical protein [Nanoarchaeota archaeon]